MKHRGEIIKKILEQKGVNLSWLSKQIKTSTRTLYNWFELQDLPLEKVVKVGLAISYDFSQDIPEIAKFFPKEGFEDTDYRKKYFDLLEEHNALLSEQLKRAKAWEDEQKLKVAAEPRQTYKKKK